MKIHVKHILVNHRHEAEDLTRRLEKGDSFEELARKYSTCPSSAEGGDLGPVDSNRLDSDFVEAAQELKSGQVSKAVRTRFGYHLIYRM